MGKKSSSEKLVIAAASAGAAVGAAYLAVGNAIFNKTMSKKSIAKKMDEKKIARAEHKYARISPRKVEIICNMIRGKNAKYAMALMENTPKAGCELMIKVLKSAMANAENNFEMDPEKLYVCETYAGAGPILKRGMPRAQGRMYRINKRTSHIMIAVAERD